MTEAAFFSWILSGLRKMTLRWAPQSTAVNRVRRPYEGPDKRIKWEYQCSVCQGWYFRKQVEIDHTVPCGGLKSFAQAGTWLERALVEADGYTILCSPCHKLKTDTERGHLK